VDCDPTGPAGNQLLTKFRPFEEDSADGGR